MGSNPDYLCSFSNMVPRVKQPLQDITDHVLSTHRRKLRCELNAESAMPSSLPPSSPPSASSHLPEPKVDHIFTHQPSSLPRLSTDDVFGDLPSDDELEDGRDVIDPDE